MQITNNSLVTLHFSLALPDGEVIDSNFDGSAATFQMGDGSLLEGFEACLLGLTAGDKKTVQIAAQEAFGEHMEDNVQNFKRHQFGADMVLEPGVVVSFADAAGAELPGVVSRLDGDYVTVDFNHPLAGKDITFSVSVVSVAEAPQEV
ncbi:FKBP-type peptidyl-prolyl cis-trans isomerase [Salinispirillum sp. LH 10-3-1]|uniref:Peptidyl-prolyl cis-trans isomerase n=1 Tax=Salinispirillum sp. LH 10-3-1 TaxID=2952525 RepID=A0AB38YI28_9GAMM